MVENIAAVILGFFAGMLVNYLADILPVRRRLAQPICLNCGHPQPVANYLFWPRKCLHCGKSRTKRTWVVELAGIVLAVWLVNVPEASQRLGVFLGGMVLIYFGVIFVIDFEHKLILHPTSIFGAIFGALLGIWLNGFWNTVVGGAVGYGIMYTLYAFGSLFTRLISRMRGQKVDEVALGFGDVNLTGVLGLMLGWPNIIIAIFLSVLIAGVGGMLLLITKLFTRRYRSFVTAMPYGPFLLLGAFLMLFLPEFTQIVLSRISPIY